MIFILLLLLNSLSIGSTTQFCASSRTCTNEAFCQPYYYREGGFCVDCWKCCTFPAYFDAKCLDTCGCASPGDLCSNAVDCGAGMYCDTDSTCRSCINCDDDLCSPQCLDISTDPNISTEAKKHMYYSQMLYQQGELSKSELTKIIANPGHMSVVLECPSLGFDSPLQTHLGCPCPQYPNATKLSCPKGSTCVPQGMLRMSSDFVLGGTNTFLDGYCRECIGGELCETYGLVGTPPQCPEGASCSTPILSSQCTNGTYCPKGTISPISCEYSSLLIHEEYLKLPSSRVIDRILYNLDPYRGNYCPGVVKDRLIDPTNVCPGGYYCPSSGLLVECPTGFFCRKQSVQPIPCYILTICPPRTIAPSFSYIVIVFYIVLIFVIFGLNTLQNWLDIRRSKITHKRDLEIPQVFTTHIRPIQYIEYCNVSAQSFSSQTWLSPTTGEFKICKLNAVMGSSGCGKSTLIDMIRGRVREGVISGTISIGDRTNHMTFDASKLYKPNDQLHNMRKLIGFVPQDDIIINNLTVYENLLYSCRLKVANHIVARDVDRTIVAYVCSALGLDSKTQNSIVGSVDKRGISGGQRKRVSVGLELVGLHPILIMDEPTTGLDATASQSMLMFFKNLSAIGLTIITIVHQPRYSAFLLFDQITLLSKYGLAFCGSPVEAIAYYNKFMMVDMTLNDNPADVIMDVLTYGTLTHYMDQKEQVDTWESYGRSHINELHRRFPYYDIMMQANISYNDQTIQEIKNVENLNSLVDLLDRYRITIKAKELKLLNEKMQLGDNKSTALSRYISSVCNKYIYDDRFINPVSKLKLFDDDVQGTIKTLNSIPGDGQHKLRILFLVSKFVYILMSRVGKRPQHLRDTEEKLEFCILRLVLSIKAKNEIVHRRIANARVAYNQPVTTAFTNPSFVNQISVLVKRRLIAIYRSPWAIQLIIPSLTAVIVGAIQGSEWSLSSFASNVTMATVCVGVLSIITHTRTFSTEKQFMSREISNNTSLGAYFIAYNVTDIIWLVLLPLTYYIPYYYLTFPLTSFAWFYLTGLLVCWWSSGVAYMVSSSNLEIQWVNLIAVFIAIIFGAFLNGLNPSLQEASSNGFLKFLLGLSYNRWAMEALVIYEFSEYEQHMLNKIYAYASRIGVCGLTTTNTLPDIDRVLMFLQTDSKNILNACSKYISTAYIVLFVEGLCFRMCSFVVMWYNYDTMSNRLYMQVKYLVSKKIQKLREWLHRHIAFLYVHQ